MEGGQSKVTNLRKRIFVAARRKDFKKLRSLQKLIVSSRCNWLYSIRRITQMNQGSSTPGLDNLVYSTPESRMGLFKLLLNTNIKGFVPTTVKRIYIPKPDGKQRPIGIPTLLDRVLQQIVKNALEPEWEAKFESSCYGFRPSRVARMDNIITRPCLVLTRWD